MNKKEEHVAAERRGKRSRGAATLARRAKLMEQKLFASELGLCAFSSAEIALIYIRIRANAIG